VSSHVAKMFKKKIGDRKLRKNLLISALWRRIGKSCSSPWEYAVLSCMGWNLRDSGLWGLCASSLWS
jgi:hypothetical protein